MMKKVLVEFLNGAMVGAALVCLLAVWVAMP